jgi:hypothetical protein
VAFAKTIAAWRAPGRRQWRKNDTKGEDIMAITPKHVALSAAVLLALSAGAARAERFTTAGGLEGEWNLNLSLGSSARTGNIDRKLVSAGNTLPDGTRGVANTGSDNGNLNFDKGDIFSTVLKGIGDVRLKGETFGGLLRVKAWTDFTLENKSVRVGSGANAYSPNSELVDSGADRPTRFSGVELLDAYVWGDFKTAVPVTARLGRHLVNWGESQFIAGVNQYGAFDIQAARRPGAQIKEIMLPTNQLSVSMSPAEGVSVEAFYQLEWRKHLFDVCGTYFSQVNVLNCRKDFAQIFPPNLGPLTFSDAQIMNNGITFPPLGLVNRNGVLDWAPDIEGKDSGQYGLSARYFSKALDTELGAYFVNYHSRAPIISVIKGLPTTYPASVWNGTVPALRNAAITGVLDYSAENIKVYGLSASTQLGAWSVGGEVSHHEGIPLQLNAPDMLQAIAFNAGPLRERFAATANGATWHAFDRKDKSQAQMYAVRIVPNLMGAESLFVVAEAAVQRWRGIEDHATGVRYGRNFVFRAADWNLGGPGQIACTAPNLASVLRESNEYCGTGGFFTRNAWGYRVLGELSYPSVFAGVNLKPRLFFAHDVSGYSGDAAFIKGRRVVSLGLRAEYTQRYYVDVGYTRYNRSATYDSLHDRDFASVVAGINF